MKNATPTAVETAPPLETNPLERPPHGPTNARTPPPQPPAGRGWIWWVVLLALAGVGYWQWPKLKTFLPSDDAAGKAMGKAGRGRRGAGGGTAEVVAARATKGTIKVFVQGLGAVTPIYTVTVKSRVDGQLMKVHFKEGQIVHKGDLAGRDRPAALSGRQLDQAKGNLIHDQALLKNAHVDLDRYKMLLNQHAIPEQQLRYAGSAGDAV